MANADEGQQHPALGAREFFLLMAKLVAVTGINL